MTDVHSGEGTGVQGEMIIQGQRALGKVNNKIRMAHPTMIKNKDLPVDAAQDIGQGTSKTFFISRSYQQIDDDKCDIWTLLIKHFFIA